MNDELSDDGLQGGRLRFCQPARGYRIAVDPILLAAAVPARAGDVVLDAGAGTGAAMLCLAARVQGCLVVGLEVQPELLRIGRTNAAENRAMAPCVVVGGDALRPPFAPSAFDHVMTNPPYLKAGCVSPPPDPVRAKAHVELGFGLPGWIEAVTRTLRDGGTLTVVHRGDRLLDLLGAFGEHFGAVTVFPLWPSAGRVEARRIIVQGRKGSKAPLRLRSGMVLHGRDGSFTADAESVLRHLAPLPIANES